MTRQEAEAMLAHIDAELNDENCPPRAYRRLLQEKIALLRRLDLQGTHPDALEDDEPE